MAFMPDLIQRLRREQWVDANELAEEFIAAFITDKPIRITSPVEIGPTGSIPPLTINTTIQQNGQVTDPIVTRIVGGIVPTAALPEDEEPIQAEGGGGNAYLGVVTGGSGTTYTCTITDSKGVSTAGVAVTMANLSADAELPAGVEVMVLKIGAVFRAFPSVFYGP